MGIFGDIFEQGIKNRAEIAAALKEFYRWLQEGHTGKKILVVGPAGVGKTTLAQFLTGGYDLLLDTPLIYRSDVNTAEIRGAQHPSRLVVVPGDFHRRQAVWKPKLDLVERGEFGGIIFVNAWGYQTPKTSSIENDDLHPQTNGIADFREKYFGRGREEELETLRQVLPFVVRCTKPMWLLSFVAKQDLWLPNSPAVEQHYRAGAYDAVFRELLGAARYQEQRHELLFGATVIQQLQTETNEVLCKNAAGYDQVHQIRGMKQLIDTLDALRQWEQET